MNRSIDASAKYYRKRSFWSWPLWSEPAVTGPRPLLWWHWATARVQGEYITRVHVMYSPCAHMYTCECPVWEISCLFITWNTILGDMILPVLQTVFFAMALIINLTCNLLCFVRRLYFVIEHSINNSVCISFQVYMGVHNNAELLPMARKCAKIFKKGYKQLKPSHFFVERCVPQMEVSVDVRG